MGVPPVAPATTTAATTTAATTAIAVVLLAVACAPSAERTPTDVGIRATPSVTPAATVADTAPSVVTVPYRVERLTSDPATGDFERVVRATLDDPRGWRRAGFVLFPDGTAQFRIVLAEGPDVDRLCLPYQTYGRYSCQLGPTVAINADRWRTGTPQWTGDLAAYRVMLINHEVGHLLGQKHPDVQCPAPGELAPVMAQQSTELGRCRPNPWPLDAEIERAARHDLPLAPPFER